MSWYVEPNMIELLPVDRPDQIPLIRWPNEVKVSNKPNWDQYRRYFLAMQQQKAKSESGSSDDDEEL